MELIDFFVSERVQQTNLDLTRNAVLAALGVALRLGTSLKLPATLSVDSARTLRTHRAPRSWIPSPSAPIMNLRSQAFQAKSQSTRPKPGAHIPKP